MNNNKIYSSVILALFFISLFLTGLYALAQNNRKNILTYCSSYNSENRASTVSYFSGMETDNMPLDLESTIVSIDRRSLVLKDVIRRDSMYLIFRYPLSYCGDCIDDIFEQLHHLNENMHCIQVIVILSHYLTAREVRIKMLPYEDKFRIYRALIYNIGLPLDKEEVPYFVFVDDGKTAKHSLVTTQNTVSIVSEYLQMLSNRYCN